MTIGQTLQELAGISGQHQKRQVRNNIRNRRVEDRSRKLGRTKPASNPAGRAFRQSRLMPSPATTGTSTRRPRAMMSDAIETC